jgi:YD repeat-containing protein
VTQHYYDWRDRAVATTAGVQASEADGTHRPITYVQLDNLGAVVSSERDDGDDVTVVDANGDGVPDRPAAGLLRAKATALYDDRGRVYQANTRSVDPAPGAVSTYSLYTDTWYDHLGHVLKVVQPSGLVTKMQYDGAGRVTTTYTGDGGGDATWADAAAVTGDAVLEQVQYQYDADGNVILTTTKQRFHDETATGALGLAVFAGMLGVTLFGAFLAPVFFFVIQRLGDRRGTKPRPAPAAASSGLVAGPLSNPIPGQARGHPPDARHPACWRRKATR